MRHRSREQNLFWQRFDSVRAKETGGDCELLLDKLVSLQIPALCTHRDIVERIARESQGSIAIQSLDDSLSQTTFPRGKTILGQAGNEIDQIAAHYENMRWWISKGGLNMAVVPAIAVRLSRFDQFVGKLYSEASKNGKLSKEILVVIAKELDAAGFFLKEELQQAQWKPIAEYNQKNPRHPIQTFEQACRYPTCVRFVRRRLYVARGRYIKANSPVSSLRGMSLI